MKETYVAIETWKYENTIQICTVLALLSTKRKIVIFRKNNIFYKSNNLFLIKMYNLKKILINFDDLIIRYHLIKFYNSAVLILFLIEIKNFTYKFIFVHYIWQSFLPKYLLFPLTHNFSLSKSFKYTS